MAREARQHLLSIYQQDRDWEKAIEMAQLLSHDDQTTSLKSPSSIAKSPAAVQIQLRRRPLQHRQRLKPTKNGANIILGDIEYRQATSSLPP